MSSTNTSAHLNRNLRRQLFIALQKSTRSSCKSERCNIELVSAGVCCEHGFLLIAVFDWDMPIAQSDVHCTEYASLAKTKGIEGVVDPRQQVSVLLSDAVEASIIDAKTPRSIFLPSHDYRSRPWGIRLVDNSVLQHEVELLPHFDFLSR